MNECIDMTRMVVFSACFAEGITFPLDRLKTLSQMGRSPGLTEIQSFSHGVKYTYNSSGMFGFYRGIQAAVPRQILHNAVSLYLYEQIKDGPKWMKAIAAGLASFVTNPLEIAKIRLINNSEGKMIGTLANIYRNDGLFKGASANVSITTLIFVFEAYNNLYSFLGPYFAGGTKAVASLLTGLAASVVISPIDVVKSRYMQATKPDPNTLRGNELRFLSPLDCFKKVVSHEGALALYRGFAFLWLRVTISNLALISTMGALQDYKESSLMKNSVKRALKSED